MSGENDTDRKHSAPPGEAPAPSAAPAPKKDWLGDQLRDLYSAYEEEPLPDDLAKLLDKLDDSDTNSGNGAAQ